MSSPSFKCLSPSPSFAVSVGLVMALLCGTSPVWSQAAAPLQSRQAASSPPAKPKPAKPAHSPGLQASQAAAPELPLMSREELRACMELSESLKLRDAQLQEAAAASAEKRAEIDAAGEALRAQRLGINPKDRKAVETFNDAIRLHDLRLQAFREHYEGLQEKDRALQADSARYDTQCLTKRYRPEDEQELRETLGKSPRHQAP
jgi:hypothetical protein